MSRPRSHALDALRGYAIMTMVLSATEAFRVLPAWMYHAQVPPPEHVFTPTRYGITWVDLVFPFFLFAMGAAIPLSMERQLEQGTGCQRLVWKSVLRWLKLVFFAIYCQHVLPSVMGWEPGWLNAIASVVAFGWMFLLFMPNPLGLPDGPRRLVNGGAYVVAVAWMVLQPYRQGKPFALTDSDIIILILSNVAFTGALVYLFTRRNKLARMVVMAFVTFVFLGGEGGEGWQHQLLHWQPLPWLFRPVFQEYLLIIIPGTFAGELLRQWMGHHKVDDIGRQHSAMAVALLSLLLVVGNVVLLYTRWLLANVLVSALLIAVVGKVLPHHGGESRFWRDLWCYGSVMLMLGLTIEAFQGGIRKDDVTLSYLFATSGLAFFALLVLTVVCDHYQVRWVSAPLEYTGRNPLVAYVACSLLVIPLLQLTGLYPLLQQLEATPLTGLLKGVVLTAITMAVAAWCTQRKWYWKT